MTASILTMRPLPETLTPQPTVETSKERATVCAADTEARQWVAAIARGDDAAFERLYERYHRRLLRLALMLGRGDDSLAQEAVQATFIVAAGKLRRVDGEEHLWNWLAQVARQQIARALRQRKRDDAVVSAEELSGLAMTRESDRQLEEILDAALGSLDPEERQIIERFYFDQLSQKEMAEQLNTTPKAVSSRLERARARLRSFIAKSFGPGANRSHET
jgi:RNA polymerase sigma-70 factor, ECF subfamily